MGLLEHAVLEGLPDRYSTEIEASRISGLDPKGETEGAAVLAAGEGAKVSRPAVGEAGAADVGREAGPGDSPQGRRTGSQRRRPWARAPGV